VILLEIEAERRSRWINKNPVKTLSLSHDSR